MPVDLRGDARVLVAHDPLDGGQVGALHEQERGRRVAEVVEAQLPDLANGEQLELADRAASGVRVGRGLLMAAALSPALVDVARHDARATHGSTEDLLAEWNLDFDDLAGANIVGTLSALVCVDAASTGTFNLRVGGTVGAPDGDVRATVSTTSLPDEQKTATDAPFPKPAGQTLVKVTGVDDTAAISARIRGISAVLRAA